MGPLSGLMGMLPMVPKEVRNMELDDAMLKPVEADHPLDDRRPKGRTLRSSTARGGTRIANGSGTTVQDVNELLERFKQVQAYMRQVPGLAGDAAAERRKKGGRQAKEAPVSLRPRRGPGTSLTWPVHDAPTLTPGPNKGTKADDMAVKLRLMRMGKTKQPTYRVVAADSRSPRERAFHRDRR